MIWSSFIAVSQYKVSSIELGKEVTAMASAKDGQLYYGTKDGEFGLYNGLIAESLRILPSINKIVNQEGVIWICTTKGLYKSINNRLDNISGSHLHVLDYDYKNDLIIAEQGIYTNGPTGYHPSTKDKIPQYHSISKAKVLYSGQKTYLLIDDEVICKSRWWKQLTDSIIDITAKDDAIIIAKSDGLYDDRDTMLHYLSLDNKARLFTTDEGRSYLTNDNFISEVSDDRIRNIYSLNSQEVTVLYEDSWQNVWVARSDYLYRISPSSENQKIQLSIVSINGDEQINSVRLSESNNILRVKYKGVQLTSPQLIRYQSQLEGYSEWSESTIEDEVTYEDIKPGTYTYRLRATLDGSNYTYGKKVKVTVVSSFLSWIWIGLFMSALGILLTAYIGNRRMLSFKSKVDDERRQLLSKNKLLTLEQKALQLQMNPHFIFNALNSIKGQMAMGDTKSARQSITKFAHLMRTTLDMSRAEYVLLVDEVNYLRQYLTLEQWINEDAFDFEIIVDQSIDQSCKIPTMLIQPFVENAIKHAFVRAKSKGNIAVNIDKDRNDISLRIIDDGIGIGNNENKTTHTSVAISVVKERLEIKYPKFKGELVEINSPSRKGNGTEVIVTIPNAAI